MDEVERGMVKEEELGQVWWVQVTQELTKMATKEAVQQENPLLILIMAILLLDHPNKIALMDTVRQTCLS
jgi:hypothetical protein